MLDVHLEELDTPIGATALHPFWSEDRQQFVSAGKLQRGERLRTLEGLAHVREIIPRGPPQPVYNLEVSVDHTYLVGEAGVWVHNASNCNLAKNKAAGRAWENKIKGNPAPGHQAADQVTMVVDTPSGPVTIRADQVIRNDQTGALTVVEAKASAPHD